MPGPLSLTVTRKRVAWLAGGGAAPLLDATSSLTTTSARMLASSDASSALSTASLTQVRSAFLGLSKPSRWRFLVKNSDTEMSRWRAPISAAETAAFGSAVGTLASTVAIAFLDTKPTLAGPIFSYPPFGTRCRIGLRRLSVAESSREQPRSHGKALLSRDDVV